MLKRGIEPLFYHYVQHACLLPDSNREPDASVRLPLRHLSICCGPEENRTLPRSVQGSIASLGTCKPMIQARKLNALRFPRVPFLLSSQPCVALSYLPNYLTLFNRHVHGLSECYAHIQLSNGCCTLHQKERVCLLVEPVGLEPTNTAVQGRPCTN